MKAFTVLKDSHTNIRAWLYVVARNFCLNCMKKAGKEFLPGETPAEWSADMNAANSGSSGRDVLEEIVEKERRQRIWQAVNKLPVQQREVIMLQYFGGFRQKEIAAMLQLTPENVRVLSHRARKALKKALEVEQDDIS